jgi:DNA-directed RNA polymerase subunit RPC12/RpoP
VNEQAFSLEHQCPQCGAPVELLETDRIFSCPFCHVRLCIFSPTHSSYFLKPLASPQGDLFFIPYWRIRATRMMISETARRAEIVDHSALAVPFKEFQPTLGIRSQTLMLKFVEPGSPGVFFPPIMEKDDFVKQIQNNPLHTQELTRGASEAVARNVAVLNRLGTPGLEVFAPGLKNETLMQALIGEMVSLVYAPFFIQGKTVIDGITGRPAFTDQSAESLLALPEKYHARLSFVPTLCPQCDWNLQGENETLVLVCPHCWTAWQASEQGMRPVEARFLPGGSSATGVPFWVLDVDYGALKLGSLADFIRLTNIAIPITSASEEKSFSMWMPAFKANPDLYFRLGKHLSSLQWDFRKSGDPPENFYPVTLPASEAFQGLPIMLGEIAVAKKKAFPLITRAAFSLRGATLVFVPFVERGAELVQPRSNIAISKNALAWGRGI